MESIKSVLNQQALVDSNSTNQSLTNTQQRKNLGVSREKIGAMLSVLNKRWLSKSWRAMDPEDSEPMALAFIEVLDKNSIPYEHYHALYLRALDLRIARLNQGLSCEDFSAELMAACWPALRTELNRQKTTSIDKQIEMGGEPCPDDIAEKLKRFGVRL